MYIVEELKKYFKEKVQSFKDYINTGVTMVNPALAREQSSKSINPTTYDRYTVLGKDGKPKYHYTAGEMSKLDKVIGDVVENTINSIKKVIPNDS